MFIKRLFVNFVLNNNTLQIDSTIWYLVSEKKSSLLSKTYKTIKLRYLTIILLRKGWKLKPTRAWNKNKTKILNIQNFQVFNV